MEQKLKGLATFLNAAFKYAKVNFDAVVEDENVVVKQSDGVLYEVSVDVEKQWWSIYGMVPIPQTRDTPADMDVELVATVRNVPDVFRKVMQLELDNSLDGWIESATVELNPDAAEVF